MVRVTFLAASRAEVVTATWTHSKTSEGSDEDRRSLGLEQQNAGSMVSLKQESHPEPTA
jgi:hypothetical protein